MNLVKAQLKNYRQSPRKVRLIADAVRGKNVEDAIATLSFIQKRSSLPIKKLIDSALANAKDLSLPTDSLIVKEISVNSGRILYRSRPRSRGMANRIRKRTSHVNVILAESEIKAKAKDNKKKIEN